MTGYVVTRAASTATLKTSAAFIVPGQSVTFTAQVASRTKRGRLKSPKAGVRNGQVERRVFSLSPSLAEQLRPFVEGRAADQPLFLTPGRLSKSGKRIGGGVRLEPDNFVKRALKPVLKELDLDGGAHAFRHGNATLLDSLRAPMAVRQERLGHVDPKTTMGYTHLVTADDGCACSQSTR